MAAARNELVRLALAAAVGSVVFLAAPRPAWAQFFGPIAGELSETVYIDKVDSAVRTHLEQVETYLAGQQWEEAIDTLRQLQQSHGGKVVNLTPTRLVNLRDYCHLKILQMGPPGLARYRQRVDTTAEAWHRQAVQSRDGALLRQIVDELFCSSWTDQALFALGELALEKGDYDAARRHWERIVPSPPSDQPTLRLAIPDTDLSLTDVRARLVLTSILEGSTERAAGELEAFDRLHPGAEGHLAGRKVAYAPVLSSLLETSREWPAPRQSAPWTTFAGHPSRQATPPKLAAIGGLEWRQTLEAPPALDASVARNLGFRPRRVAEDNDLPLSYYPVVYRQMALVAGPTGIAAYDLETGKPAWRNPIFSDVEGVIGRQRIINRSSVGAPRYTLTVHGHRLYARMGSALTSQATESLSSGAPGYVVCLDLEQQGKELWRRSPAEEGWAFDGTPVADDERVYAAMRRTDVRPQAHVTCLDAETGRTLWTQKVSAAETPARGQHDEVTHNLLTLERDALYFNTNLGAVASLDTHDGRIRWITQYRRNSHSDLSRPAAQFYRDLTPAVFAHGRLYVAPSDSPSILSLDAATGQTLWETHHAEDAIHLLGVGGGRLLASGDRLWWIDAETGEAVHRWPDGPSPRGFGRGLLAGDQVFFPTREEIYVFDQRTGRPAPPIPLTAQFEGINGGHLALADEFLLMTTANRLKGHELVVFTPFGRLREKLQEELTAHPESPLSYLRLARCEAALGDADEALELLEQAQARTAAQTGLEATLVGQIIRRQKFELHMRQATDLANGGNGEAALAAYQRAQDAAPTVAARLESQMAAAEATMAASKSDEAMRRWQAIADDPQLGPLPVVHDPSWSTQARVWAQTKLDQLQTDQLPPREATESANAVAGPEAAETERLDLPLMRTAEQTWPGWLECVLRGDGVPRLALLHEASQVHAISLAQGTTVWSTHCQHPPLWSTAVDDSVIWLTAADVQCVAAADGQSRWTTPLLMGPPLMGPPWPQNSRVDRKVDSIDATRWRRPSAVHIADRIIVCRPQQGLTAMDVNTGAITWTFTPPQGRLAAAVAVENDELLATTADSDDIYRLSAPTGKLLAKWQGAGPVEWSPRMAGQRLALTIDSTGRLQMWDREAGQVAWSREAPDGGGYANLDVSLSARHLLTFAPGQGLRCLDPETGRERWRNPLAGDPRASTQPHVLAGVEDGVVDGREGGQAYAFWDQRLRAFDLRTGQSRWERPLGDAAVAWQVKRSGNTLICWPKWAPGQAAFDVWLLYAEDGRPMQRLSLDVPTGEARLTLAGDRLVASSPQRSWVLTGSAAAGLPVP